MFNAFVGLICVCVLASACVIVMRLSTNVHGVCALTIVHIGIISFNAVRFGSTRSKQCPE